MRSCRQILRAIWLRWALQQGRAVQQDKKPANAECLAAVLGAMTLAHLHVFLSAARCG